MSPIPRSWATFRIATPSAPDWLTKPMAPGRAGVGAKVALRLTSGAVLITPMQFGPIILTPAARTVSRSLRSRAAPSSPVSEKPAVITTSPFTPLATHSSTAPCTSCLGTRIMARSTGSGIAAIEG